MEACMPPVAHRSALRRLAMIVADSALRLKNPATPVLRAPTPLG